ncbi:MAG TPA: alpha/beta fold hydrolase [Terriglobales bacterium]|nr:alpha/beta fold hydrolase [Terriglobales bacterium]
MDSKAATFLHQPAKSNGDGFILTHGAGGNANAPLLVALADALSDAGFTVVCYNLPFRQQRPFGPPRPAGAEQDRDGLKSEVAAMRELVGGRVFLGGHSYGGRQSSMLCAEQPGLVEGLLLLSYPLHPPGKPDQLRTRHLPDLKTPTLFVSGTIDPFGSIEELNAALKLIPAKTKLLMVQQAGHDLGFKGKSKREELPMVILKTFEELIS